MEVNMDASVAGLLGALVGGGASFAGTALSSWFMLTKERETLLKQREAETAKWKREQLHSVILGAAAQMDLYITRWLEFKKDLGRAQQDSEMVRLNSEVKKCLLAILMYYPGKKDAAFGKLEECARKANYNAILKEDEAWEIRQTLITLAVAISL
jgi:hypothetical protein